MGIKESISELRQKFDADLSEVRDSESIEKLRVSYLGKKGSVTELLKGLKDLSGAEKKEFGQTINTLKREVDERITRGAHPAGGGRPPCQQRRAI